MQPKPHLAACSAFWADLGVSIEDQHAAASWAFCVPAVASEAGCMALPEDLRPRYHPERPFLPAVPVSANLHSPKEKGYHPERPFLPAVPVDPLAALAEHALLPG